MELKVDLLKGKKKKSLFRIILGILLFLCASSWVIIRVIEYGVIRPFDWINFVVFALSGIVHFVEGWGNSFGSFFGKAYILINSELISLKASVFDKSQVINWSEIKSIDYKLNKYEIKKTDNTTMVINLSMLDYVLINEIKQTITCIAKEKSIQSNS